MYTLIYIPEEDNRKNHRRRNIQIYKAESIPGFIERHMIRFSK